jgi:hypothetical protein
MKVYFKTTLLIVVVFFMMTSDAANESAKPAWPTELTLAGGGKITLYQPQVESLKDDISKARAAFKLTADKKDTYGSLLITAKTQIDKEQGLVQFEDIKVSDVQSPTATIDKKSFATEVAQELNKKIQPIAYKNLLDNLHANDQEAKAVTLQNTPPHFVFKNKPSLLIMISGDPKWVATSETKTVERIINTSALILHEKDKAYYLWALNKWFTSKELMGPYLAGKESPSSKFVMIKDDLVKKKKVDPIEGKTQKGESIYPPGLNPEIIIATQPTELLQSDGTPKYEAVANTSLLYMSNSANSIFIDSKNQNYYVLTAGRWFSAKSLDGPWSFISGKQLPKDFAKIPVTSPVAEVLVSIPGTPQAKEAVIASQIPQTAKVDRSLKPEKIECDNNKFQWAKISGTDLEYAESCNTPLLKISNDQYYVIQNGVWFNSGKPEGPWQVAIAVPDQIYKIPSSSPLYYITYVKVYGSTDKTVTVGYTPGYHGTFTSADGTIVYGTGYNYTSYSSSQNWYPAPSTYGFGVGYGWGYEEGFFMGFTMGAFMYPWGWGTCCWGPTFVNVNVTNTYTKWGEKTVVSGAGGHGVTVDTIGKQKFVKGNDSSNIYTRHDGEVYRRTPNGQWQKYNGPNTWADVNDKIGKKDLDQIHQQRASANEFHPDRTQFQNHQNFERAGGQPALRGGGGGFHGGGFHGGGGFRR